MMISMRKWVSATVICLAILIGVIYIFIPANIEISKIATIDCTVTGAYRNISDDSKWLNRWSNSHTNLSFIKSDPNSKYRSVYYSIVKKLRNEIVVKIENGQFNFTSHIDLIAKGNDSVILVWKCSLPSGWNPIGKVRRYWEAVNISDNMRIILQNIVGFLEKLENVYGISISQSSISDTCLLASKYSFSVYPNTPEIYDVVSNLKSYAFEHGTLMSGNPLLNVNKLNEHTFLVMIAIPVNRDLSAKGNIFSRRMIPGRFMVADVTGGIYTVNTAIEQLQLYFTDYQKTSMAIPFQSLIDRKSTRLN